MKLSSSLNYFPTKLPKAFGLPKLNKGYFSHLFNTIENQYYVGSIPSVTFNRGINMKHASTDHEALLAGVKVDGYCLEH